MKRIKVILLLLACIISLQAAETPATVIQKALQKVNTGAFTAQYTLSNTAQRGGQAKVYRGQITMKGAKYYINSDDLLAWFDGTTQWVYIVSDKEVTITEPTQKEAAELNPMLLVKGLQRSCSLVFSKSVKSSTDYVVEFYPKDKFSKLLYLRVYVRRTDFVPTHVKMVATKGAQTDVTLTHQACNQSAADALFVYPKAKYPKVQINDMR